MRERVIQKVVQFDCTNNVSLFNFINFNLNLLHKNHTRDNCFNQEILI
jgi:hypothetical protein